MSRSPIPKKLARGGRNTLENLITACSPCNIGKGVMDVDNRIEQTSAGVISLEPPRIEFFWTTKFENSIAFIDQARCVEWPRKGAEEWERQESEYYELCHSHHPHYSTFGFSSRDFSRHLAATKVFDLLGTHWLRGSAFTYLLDDLLMIAERGLLPDYVAPMMMRATHPEYYHEHCRERETYYEDRLDAIAKQCVAAFPRFLNREHHHSIELRSKPS